MHPWRCVPRRATHESCGCARFCNGRAGWRLNTAVSTGYTVYLPATQYLQSTVYSAGQDWSTPPVAGREGLHTLSPPHHTADYAALYRPSAIQLNRVKYSYLELLRHKRLTKTKGRLSSLQLYFAVGAEWIQKKQSQQSEAECLL